MGLVTPWRAQEACHLDANLVHSGGSSRMRYRHEL
jgi:hypothetical protein